LSPNLRKPNVPSVIRIESRERLDRMKVVVERRSLAPGGSVGDAAAQSLRVMVVEDDADQRLLVCTMLQRSGHTIVLDAERGDDPNLIGADADVAVVDLSLPGRSGVELIHALLDSKPDLPILVLSASSHSAAITEALLAGALGFVVKGTRLNEVVDAVELIARRKPAFSPEARAALSGPGEAAEKAMARLRKFL
jgi:DNA-binding NarL/FixJ family response regulator